MSNSDLSSNDLSSNDLSSNRYRILGVDPGTRAVGLAVLELGSGPRPEVVYQGAVTPRGRLPVVERLKEIHLAIRTLIDETRPDVVAVEEVFYGKNFKSAMRIGEGRGVILLAAALSGLKVAGYAPAEIKQAVTANGRASKQQVQRCVVRLLELARSPSSSDEADALAIALCHAQRSGSARRQLPTARPRPGGRRKDAAMKALLARVERTGRSG